MNVLASTISSRMIRGPIMENAFAGLRLSRLHPGAISRLHKTRTVLGGNDSDDDDDDDETPTVKTSVAAEPSEFDTALKAIGGAATQAAVLGIQGAEMKALQKQGFKPKLPSGLTGGTILGLSAGTLALIAAGVVGFMLISKKQ
jgi:hypothetical protein